MCSPARPPFRRPLITLALILGALLNSTGIGLGAAEEGRTNPRNLRPAIKQVVEGAGSDRSVFLGGRYIEVGIHYAGSFGASATPPAGFHPQPSDSLLGFVVDSDGFDTGTAPRVGDFFVPGAPEEVWGVEWNSIDGAITRMNAGLETGAQIPTDDGYPTDISSGDDRRSVWRGTAASPQNPDEQLTITQTVSFNRADRFFVMNVVLNNTGKVTINDLKYLRSVDPDQESGHDTNPDPDVTAVGETTTENYVVAQPPRGRLAGFPAGNVDRALVIGRGILTGIPLGLGAIDSRARVSHGGFSIRSASAVLDLGPVPDGDGQLYDSGREAQPRVADEAISLAFDLGDLAPGQSVSIDYAYILDAADLEVALGQLARVTILQPTGTVSGNAALFQVSTDNPDAATVKVDFYVAGNLVGTDTDGSRTGTYEVTFNTLPLANGPVTIEAVATFADDTTSRKSASVYVDNAGPPIAFTGATPAQDAVVVGSQIPIEVAGTDLQNAPAQVTIFREALGASVVLATLTQGPFVATLDVTDLDEGTVVAIKAVASNQSGTASTTIVRSVVSSLVPPGQDTVITAPTLPLSQGERTIYVAVSPGTPQGRTSLLAALTGNDPAVTRSFTWDPVIDSYVERPSSPTGGVQVSTGFFIATRVPVDFDLSGSSVSAAPTLTLPPAGWVFAGVPPFDTGNAVVTAFAWSATQVVLGGETVLDDTTTPTLAEAMGNPAVPADSTSSRPWWWNGATYEQVDVLETGKAYWFKNNLDQPLVLTFGQLPQVVDLASAKTSARSLSASEARVRDQGSPPPPPSSSAASSSSSGGCGAGSGVAAFALLLMMAGLGLVLVRR